MFRLAQGAVVSTILRRSCLFLSAAALLAALYPAPATAAKPTFKLHYVDKDNAFATAAMQTTLADLDKDGDLDWTVGNGFGKDTGFWWYEYQGPDTWVKHTLSTGDLRVGYASVALDVNGDGLLDLISGSLLFINKGNREFSKGYDIGTTIMSAQESRNHDHTVVDVNKDGKLDLVSSISCGYAGSPVGEICWYEAPADPTKPWTKHPISTGKTVPEGFEGFHASTQPYGVGDLNGDGRVDVVGACGWYENANAEGTKWIYHTPKSADGKYIFLGQDARAKTGSYQTCIRSQVLDLNGDGFPDVVESEGDITAPARIGWLKNDGKGNFTQHIIREGFKEDYHSLAVADFDGDGDIDIVTGAGPLASGPTGHVVQLFENTAGKGKDPVYVMHELTKPGNGILSDEDAAKLAAAFDVDHFHEPCFGDVNGDGKIDLVTKGWDGHNAPYDKAPNKPAPFIFMENTTAK